MKTSSIIFALSAISAVSALPGAVAAPNALAARHPHSGNTGPIAVGRSSLVARARGRKDDDDDDDNGQDRGRGRGRGRGGRGGRPDCPTSSLVLAPTPTQPPLFPGGPFGNATLNGTDILNSTTTSSIDDSAATESVSLGGDDDDGDSSNGDGDDDGPISRLAVRAFEALEAMLGM